MALPESAHPYATNTDETQTWIEPGSPSRIIVYFSSLCSTELGVDKVYLYDANDSPVGKTAGYSGTQLANLVIAIIGDTIKVRLVSDSTTQGYGYKVDKVSKASASTVLANIHVYQDDSYLNERDADGIWSQGTRFATQAYSGLGVSPGNMPGEYPSMLGAIGEFGGVTGAVWLGNGLPLDPVYFSISNALPGDTKVSWEGYWDCSAGAWWINGAWYLLLPQFNTDGGADSYRWVILKSTTYNGGDYAKPTVWMEMDQANSPSITVRIGNNERALLRWNAGTNTIDLFHRIEGTPNSNSLYTFDLTTDTWSAAYGTADFGGLVKLGLHGDVNNGIFRFPNNDIGVVYAIGDTVYYRLYVRATNSWSSASVIKTYAGADARFCTMIPDPSQEALHVFTINRSTGTGAAYHYVPHTDTIVPDCYVWDILSPDAFGNGTIFGGRIAVPFDSYDDNLIWFADITGGATTFTSEIVPRPVNQYGSIETGTPSCATIFAFSSSGSNALADTLSLSDAVEIYLFSSSLALADQLVLSDSISARLSGGDLTIRPFIDGCPEIIVASEYCTSWKPWKTNTLQEVNECHGEAFSSVPPTQCD